MWGVSRYVRSTLTCPDVPAYCDALPQVRPLGDEDKTASFDALASYMTANTFDFGAQLVFFLTAVLRGEYAASHYAVAAARRSVFPTDRPTDSGMCG